MVLSLTSLLVKFCLLLRICTMRVMGSGQEF